MAHVPNARVLTALEDWRAEIEDDRLLLPETTSTYAGPRRIPKKLRGLVESVGLPVIGLGSCRLVFEMDDMGQRLALKVGFTQMGLYANQHEFEISQDLEKEMCATVYAMDDAGLWLIQRFVAIPRHLPFRQFCDLKSWIKEHGYIHWDAVRKNFGLLPDGRLVMVDLESLWPMDKDLESFANEPSRYLY